MQVITIAILSATAALQAAPMPAGHEHSAGMDHAQMTKHDGEPPPESLPRESGQSAFAAISEVVEMLEADPKTDWSKISIDSLQEHLADMDNVLVRSRVERLAVPGGMQFTVRGEGPVIKSIQRMARNHSAMADGVDGVHVQARPIDDGAIVTQTSDKPGNPQRIAALGFYGLLTSGVHHQLHHLMIAKGTMKH